MKDFLKYLIDKVTFTSFVVVSIILGSFALVFTLMFHEVPKDSQAIVFGLLGGIVGSMATIVTFKFGSSSGSEKKTDAIINNQK
jgi:fluoride ion exporter CrcB/FEX